jgi:predicted amidohydrolase YtcJ
MVECSFPMASRAVAQDHPGTPDVIFYNGKVVAVDSDFKVQQAFAIKGDTFIAVGTDRKIRAMAGKGTRLADLKGATVVPGFTDMHDHLFNVCRYMWRGVDMIGVTSLAELQGRLKKAVAAAEPGQVVFTTLGWTIRPAPTRKELDQVSTENPIVLIGTRRGSAVYNSAALKLAGISKENPTFAGKPLPRDAFGEPTGAFTDYPTSVLLLEKLLPPMSHAEEEEVIIKGWQERNALGITSIRDLSLWPAAVRAYQRVWQKGRLTGRVAFGIEFPDAENTAMHIENMGLSHPFGDHWLRIDSTGEEPWTPATMALKPYTELMLTLNRLDWRPCPHVGADSIRNIDVDTATNAHLDAFEAADRASSIREKRWYMEHTPFATPEQIDRMAKLGVIVCLNDYGYNGTWPPPYPQEKERLAHQTPVRSLLDQKIVVISGSDYRGPTSTERHPHNPLIYFYFYVTQKAKDGKPSAPSEKISRQEALRIADFVILSQDLLTVQDDRILDTRPLATFVGGKKVYSALGNNF